MAEFLNKKIETLLNSSVNSKNIAEKLVEYIDDFGNFTWNDLLEEPVPVNVLSELKKIVLNKISENNNSYPASIINLFLSKQLFSYNDISKCEVPDRFIKSLKKYKSQQLEQGDIPTSIPEGYTEVYFWGTLTTGKSCALGAILNTARQYKFIDIIKDNKKGNKNFGTRYFNQLIDIFYPNEDGIVFLPPPSPIHLTQYFTFALDDRKIAFIDLSGEIFMAIYNEQTRTGNEKLDPKREATLSNLKNILKSKNRKIHFFFIEYVEDNVSLKDYSQVKYLKMAAQYFQNDKIFYNTTDLIYVVITKSDLIGLTGNINNYIEKYLYSYYRDFMLVLEDLCRKNDININNKCKPYIEHFSIGEVCFNRLCEFDRKCSKKIIEELIKRIPATVEKKNFIYYIKKILKS